VLNIAIQGIDVSIEPQFGDLVSLREELSTPPPPPALCGRAAASAWITPCVKGFIDIEEGEGVKSLKRLSGDSAFRGKQSAFRGE
jgi:hypothetical protein